MSVLFSTVSTVIAGGVIYCLSFFVFSFFFFLTNLTPTDVTHTYRFESYVSAVDINETLSRV